MGEVPLEVSCADVASRRASGEPLFLLDCREPGEFATAHIEGATLIPMSELTDRVDELAERRSEPVIVYCHHGGRSLRVTRWLRSQGFDQATSMAGGIDEWSLTIDPTVPRY